jgi:hypothetical protein
MKRKARLLVKAGIMSVARLFRNPEAHQRRDLQGQGGAAKDVKGDHPMFRILCCILLAGLFFVGDASADSLKVTRARVHSVNAQKNTLTVLSPDGQPVTYTVGPTCKIVDSAGREIKGGLQAKQLSRGVQVVIATQSSKAPKIAVKVIVGK